MSGARSAEWLFEATLRSYPRAFRARHGAPMRAMFRAQWAERSGRHAAGRMVFLVVVLFDSVWEGLMLRFASLRPARQGASAGGAGRGGAGGRGGGSGSRETVQAVRALVRRPAFTALAVGTLALGIGGVAAIGSVAYHVLLEPLPYADGQDIIRLWWNGRVVRPEFTEYWSASAGMIEDFGADNRTVRELTWVSSRTDATLALENGSERVQTGSAAPNFFTFLGIVPALGRLDVAADASEAGVVLSHAEWMTRWGADSAILGRTLALQNRSLPVIGVLPADFEWVGRTIGNERAAYWIVGSVPRIPGLTGFHPLVKPLPGYTVEDLRQDFARSAWAEITTYGEPLLPMSDAATAELLHANTLAPLRVRISFLLVSVLSVVLLGALSVSNLFMGRLSDRDQEMAVRLSLGASRLQLVRLIAIEAALLAVTGGLMGTLLARYGLVLIRAGAPVGIPRLAAATISPVILASVMVLTVVVAIAVLMPSAFGTVSASAAGGFNRIASRGPRHARSRTLLILSQMTIATVLLIGSSLMLRSLYAMETVDLGFEPDGVVAGRIQLPARYWTPAQDARGAGGPRAQVTSPALEADLDQFRDRLSAIPGVAAVSFVDNVPLSGAYGTRIPLDLVGQERSDVVDESELINGNRVDTRFFDLLNVSLVEGRTFRPEDMAPGAAPVAIVNDRLAARYWPGESAVGRRFYEQLDEVTENNGVALVEVAVEVVGVVAGLREISLEDVRPTLYYPKKRPAALEASPNRNLAFLVGTSSGDPSTIMPAIRRIVAVIFPGEPLRHFAPMSVTVDELMTESVFYTTLVSLFAAYGLLLSLVGIGGVIHHQISRRRNEVAIRMALGALPREVLALLGRDTALSAGAGIAIGLAIAAALTRLIESVLFEVVPLDPWTFIAIPVLFLGAAMVAAVVPVRRLTGLRPVEALRSE